MLKLTTSGIKKIYQAFDGDIERVGSYIKDIEEQLETSNQYLYSINIPFLRNIEASPITDDTSLRVVFSQSQINTEFITLKYGEDYI